MNDNVKTIKKSYIFWGSFVSIILVLIILYSTGFRITSKFKIGRVGTVSITAPLVDTSIFIDESKKIVTSKDAETVIVKLAPKKHTVIVSRDSYYPWKKDFEVRSGEKIKLEPIFVSQNASGNIVGKLDPEYYSIVNSIRNNKMPTLEKPKTSKDGSVSVWVIDGTIFAKKGDVEMEVTDIATGVKNIEFYKDRNDFILFSTANAVYVIEIDKNGGQNFMPIYKGQDPFFVQTDPNFIYIIDTNTLMQVVT